MAWLSSSSSLPPTGRPAGPQAASVVIEATLNQDTATVVITGELDLTTRPVLAERLSAVLRSRPARLILDMSGTGFMDCASARMIAGAGWFLPDGARLIIRRPSRAVRRVLTVTGFDAGCEIEDELRSEHDRHAAGCAPRPERTWPAAVR